MLVVERAEQSHGGLADALANAERLMAFDARRAEAQALEILKVVPGRPEAVLLLGTARRRGGDPAGARVLLEDLALTQPRSAKVQYELAMALAVLGESAAATAALRRAVALKPDMAEAWRALGDQLTLAGDAPGADLAYAHHIKASIHDPVLIEAATALCENRLAPAERLLREHLKQQPTDVAAIRMLAELGTRLGRHADAEALLSRCLELAPSFLAARHNYAIVLCRQQKAAEALGHIEVLLEADPSDPGYQNLKAATLSLIGEYGQSIEIYETVLAKHGGHPKVWLSYGHALKTAGRQADSINAYRRCLALTPDLGEAYWSLANLKTFRFTPAEVDLMNRQLARADLGDDDRLHLHYALGKAGEDAGEYETSFTHYAAGARIRRAQIDYDADETTAQLDRCKALFTEDFLSRRAGLGYDDPAPIFVVGLPRSGSTLIEQILASHSMVEGTMELPEILAIARALGGPKPADGAGYLRALAELNGDGLRLLGERFIERTRVQRKLGRPFFIDKMPNNFLHLGLIQLILPKAKIIDARRHPMAACFSSFKQHFARGQHFSYDLTDLGRYYRDYQALMAHFDAASPGRVHRVIYEDMVADTEAEVRRLLDYCGLPFEAACLRFYENDRAVRTASSEQVRQPIFRDGLDQWRCYAPWLGPLEASLGDVVQNYPARLDRSTG